MDTITISSVNIQGTPELLVADHQSVTTSFKKNPVNYDLELGMNGILGDSVYHTDDHGGNDKAICCYNIDRFAFWKEKLGFNLSNAAFGENLSLTGNAALEEHIFIGNRYQLGEAIVEVSQPRQPCYIIGVRHNYKKFVVHIQETGFTGFYLRTIKTGIFNSTNKLVPLFTHPDEISVMAVNRIRYHDTQNKEMLNRLANLNALTLSWQEHFGIMLNKLK
ncbi:MAG: sulfurase [Sphingobacteriales bacterium]|nr:sulfurase [Sphingobacteriales bacterium]